MVLHTLSVCTLLLLSYYTDTQIANYPYWLFDILFLNICWKLIFGELSNLHNDLVSNIKEKFNLFFSTSNVVKWTSTRSSDTKIHWTEKQKAEYCEHYEGFKFPTILSQIRVLELHRVSEISGNIINDLIEFQKYSKH